MKKPFNPVTSECDFRRFREIDAWYVDKSLFIRDIINNAETNMVILRPRRFGKTLNISMLEYFFSNKETEINRPLFDGLAITKDAACMAHFGQYPTLFLTLKDIKAPTYAQFIEAMQNQISKLYQRFPELLTSTSLNEVDQKIFHKIYHKECSIVELQSSLENLSHYLYQHYQQYVVILLDEYDTPLHESLTTETPYYAGCIRFMRSFLGSTFKGNKAVKKAVITGILQVGKESIFSDANNLIIHSMLDDNHYASYFGFTEEEVAELVRMHDILSLEELRRWYNSYEIRNVKLYNPFSVIKAFYYQECGPYWMNSSSNDLIKKVLRESDAAIKNEIAVFLQEGSIRTRVNNKVSFSDLHQPNVLWGLLVSTGYLSASNRTLDEEGEACYSVRVPNQEVEMMYRQMVNHWFTYPEQGYYTEFLDSIVAGNPIQLEHALNLYLQESASFFEINLKTPEKTYAVFMLGIVAGLKNHYIISSNVEVGYGRCDVVMSPKDKTKTGILIEFKRCKDGDFEKSNRKAFAQIATKQYVAKLQSEGVASIRQYAISFYGQVAKVEML